MSTKPIATNGKFSKLRIMAFVFVIALLLDTMTTVMADALAEPQSIIERTSNQIKSRLRDKQFAKNFPQVVDYVGTVIDPYIDYDLLSVLVLGKFWKTATDAEKVRFKKEFKTLLLRTYARVFVELDDWEIEFLPGISKTGGNKVLIKTKVKQPGRQAVAVDYRMLESGAQWKVYDILIDGVSLVMTYRSNFKNDIETMGSLTPLIDKLVKKNAELAEDGGK
ncbi:MlaC/ttg2D family ABC transporter substrate-binding protein [Methylomonas sp. MgM2]